MSIIIRGMEMPTSCSECALCGYYGKGDHVCDITGKDVVYELSLEKRLDDCPLVEIPPLRRGKWIKPTRVPDSMLDECSLCGFDCGSYTYNYCPSCGAKMEIGT